MNKEVKRIWIRVITIIATISIVLGTAFLAMYNANNNPHFFEMSIYQVSSVFIAMAITFYLTQKKNDERKLKEVVGSVAESLQAIIASESAVKITESTIDKELWMLVRRINNKIDILDKYSKRLKIKSETDYIKNEFKGYRELLENHINDKPYLQKSDGELRKYINNIDSKLDCIKVELYV